MEGATPQRIVPTTRYRHCMRPAYAATHITAHKATQDRQPWNRWLRSYPKNLLSSCLSCGLICGLIEFLQSSYRNPLGNVGKVKRIRYHNPKLEIAQRSLNRVGFARLYKGDFRRSDARKDYPHVNFDASIYLSTRLGKQFGPPRPTEPLSRPGGGRQLPAYKPPSTRRGKR